MHSPHVARRTPLLILVTALGLSCTSAEAPPAAGEVPALVVSPAALAFDASEGGGRPTPQSVAVSASGGSRVERLSASVTYPATQEIAWLDAVLGGSATPSVLTVVPNTTRLPAGVHRATVEISSPEAGNAPALIAVTYTLGEGAALTISPAAVGFGASAGGANPGTQTVQVGSTSGSPIGDLDVTTAYAANQAAGWLTATLASSRTPALLTIAAVTGALPPGSYTGTVTVSSATPGVQPKSIAVTFVVGTGPSIVLGRSAVAFEATAGASPPPSQTVTISNGGGGSLSGLGVGTVTYGSGASGWLGTPTISGTTAPATLALAPLISGLAQGTYTATVPVTSSAAGVTNSPQSVAVTLVVGPGAQSLLVSVAGTGASGAVTSAPAGIDCRLTAGLASGDCSESLSFGTAVTLAAAPSGGSTFTGWGGSCSGTGTCQLTMNRAHSVIANFSQARVIGSLVLVQAPAGAADSAPFLTQPRVQVFDNFGQPFRQAGITVQALLQSGPGGRIGTNTVVTDANGVASWSDLGLNAVAPPAEFELRFALRDMPAVFVDAPRVMVVPSAIVTVRAQAELGLFDLSPGFGNVTGPGIDCRTVNSGACTSVLAIGSTATFTARPDADSFQLDWRRPLSCATNRLGTCSVTIDAPVTVEANFALRGYEVILTVTGTGASGDVFLDSSPQRPQICLLTEGVQSGGCRITSLYGARTVYLRATPAPGSRFVGWSGDCTGTSLECRVQPLPGGIRTVTATFSR